MKIDWRRKLSSRKFWAAAAGFAASVMAALNLSENAASQVTAILGGLSTLVIYILAEAYVDAQGSSDTLSIKDAGCVDSKDCANEAGGKNNSESADGGE